MGVDGRAFDALLKKQHFIVSRVQALRLGFSAYDVRRRLEDGPWRTIFPGVYVVHAFPPTHDQWCQAALLRAGEPAWLYGRTAARLHGLWGFSPRDDQLDVPMLPIILAVPHSRRLDETDDVVVVRSRNFDDADLTHRRGFPTFDVMPTLLHVAAEATQQQLAMAYADVVRRGFFSRLKKRLEQDPPGREGVDLVHDLVATLGIRARQVKSPLEAWCADVLRRGGLYPEMQWKLEHGGRRCFLDFAFPELKLAIEADGRKVHAGDPFFDNDRVRWNWIANRGWSQLKFTWRQMYDERYVVTTINERITALRDASGALPAAG